MLGERRVAVDPRDLERSDREDAALAPEVESLGTRAAVTDTIMRDAASRRALAEATIEAVLS